MGNAISDEMMHLPGHSSKVKEKYCGYNHQTGE